MSDAARLGKVPLTWAYQGQSYTLAPLDLDVELLFQTEHEAFACAGLDARRGKIGEASYRTRAALQEDSLNANEFAFGGDLSFRFLLTDWGASILFEILMQKARGAVVGREQLRALARENHEAWGRLWRMVMRRDFFSRFKSEALAEPTSPGSSGGQSVADGAIPSTSTIASS